MKQEAALIRQPMRTPRAAAVAGIVFSILLIISLVLLGVSVPTDPQEAGTWLARSWKTVNLALNLLPFSGIAFLWFIGVLRDRMGAFEDRLFATVFLNNVAQADDETRSIEYEMKVQRVVQCCLWRLPLVALDVPEQNFQQGIGVKSRELSVYEGCRNGELVGATYDAGERSQ